MNILKSEEEIKKILQKMKDVKSSADIFSEIVEEQIEAKKV